MADNPSVKVMNPPPTEGEAYKGARPSTLPVPASPAPAPAQTQSTAAPATSAPAPKKEAR